MLPGGWVTLRDVYHCATDKELFARRIQQAQTYAADMSDTWITIAASEMKGDQITPLRSVGFQPDPADTNRFRVRAEPAPIRLRIGMRTGPLPRAWSRPHTLHNARRIRALLPPGGRIPCSRA